MLQKLAVTCECPATDWEYFEYKLHSSVGVRALPEKAFWGVDGGFVGIAPPSRQFDVVALGPHQPKYTSMSNAPLAVGVAESHATPPPPPPPPTPCR